MTPIEKAAAYVVGVAESEVGYIEKKSNEQLTDKTANAGPPYNNYTKYGAYFDNQRGEYEYYNGKKNGFDWCDQFVDWCFAIAFGIDNGRRMLYQPMKSLGAGCKYSAGYFRANNAWTTVPKIGDQVFFGKKGDESHTGIVVDVSADKVWTIEGNANNRVMKRVYYLNDGNIAGYGRPNLALVADRFADPLPPIADDPDPEYITAEDAEEIFNNLIEKRFGKPIKTINDIPHKSVQKVVRKLLDLEAIDGGTPYEKDPDDVNLGAYDFVRVLVMAARYADDLEAQDG